MSIKKISYNNFVKGSNYTRIKRPVGIGHRALYFTPKEYAEEEIYSIEKFIVKDARMIDGEQHLDVWLNPKFFPNNGGDKTLISKNVQEFTTSQLTIKL